MKNHKLATLMGLVTSMLKEEKTNKTKTIPIASLQYLSEGDKATFEYHNKPRNGRVVAHDFVNSRTLIQEDDLNHPKWYSWRKADSEKLVYQSV